MDIEEVRKEINEQLDMMQEAENIRIEMTCEPVLIANTKEHGTIYLGGNRRLIIIFENVITSEQITEKLEDKE